MQRPLPDTPTTSSQPTEVILDEYKAIIDDLGYIAARRQTTNDVFVGLNVVFLTGVGLLLFSSHLTSWWIVGVMAMITLLVYPINQAWYVTLTRYRNTISINYQCLTELEERFGLAAKLYSRRNQARRAGEGFTRAERRLALYFLGVYPLLTLGVLILTYLVSQHLLAPLKLT